jgi:nucleoside-diphosphate-sugar epimerase
VRDFVYIEDVVDILYYLISQQQKGVVNIGSGVGIEIEAASRKVIGLLGREDLITFHDQVSQKSIVVSNPEKLNSIIGVYPWRTLDSALSESVIARTDLNQ